MGEKLTGWEALTLWALLAEGGKSYWTPLLKKKMISKDHAAVREALKRKGLIATEKRSGKGKGIWMEVTEAGWRRAGENLSVKLPTTQTSSAVFEAWLSQLERFLHAKDLPLAEFFGPTAASSGDNETALIGEHPQIGVSRLRSDAQAHPQLLSRRNRWTIQQGRAVERSPREACRH